jgi:hypothetical protein
LVYQGVRLLQGMGNLISDGLTLVYIHSKRPHSW